PPPLHELRPGGLAGGTPGDARLPLQDRTTHHPQRSHANPGHPPDPSSNLTPTTNTGGTGASTHPRDTANRAHQGRGEPRKPQRGAGNRAKKIKPRPDTPAPPSDSATPPPTAPHCRRPRPTPPRQPAPQPPRRPRRTAPDPRQGQ